MFTESMKDTHTILIPMMLPIHFSMFKSILKARGYKVDVLVSTNDASAIAATGLRFTHNDTCFPAQLTIGQLIHAVQTRNYDPDKVALMLMQTGGGCRASNYVSLLRKALKQAKLEQIPVLSFNMAGLEKNPGFPITKQLVTELAVSILWGDLMMHLHNQIEPYELEKGATQKVTDNLLCQLDEMFQKNLPRENDVEKVAEKILSAYASIPVDEEIPKKTKVGIVGEIYVKFAPLGNNNLEKFLKNENVELVVPGLMDFVLYTIDAGIEDSRLYGGGWIKKFISLQLFKRIVQKQEAIISLYKRYPSFTAPTPFLKTKEMAQKAIHIGTKMGEGWLLTGEMIELIHQGVYNIVCTQPFGCLPNHIAGRGMLRRIKAMYPKANIVAIDYDASAAQVNQENRIKLMLQSANLPKPSH